MPDLQIAQSGGDIQPDDAQRAYTQGQAHWMGLPLLSEGGERMKRNFYTISNASWPDVSPPFVRGSYETFDAAKADCGGGIILNAQTGEQYEWHIGDEWRLIDTAEHTPT